MPPGLYRKIPQATKVVLTFYHPESGSRRDRQNSTYTEIDGYIKVSRHSRVLLCGFRASELHLKMQIETEVKLLPLGSSTVGGKTEVA